MIGSLQDLVNSFQGTADRLTSGVESNLEALMQKQLREATDRYARKSFDFHYAEYVFDVCNVDHKRSKVNFNKIIRTWSTGNISLNFQFIE